MCVGLDAVIYTHIPALAESSLSPFFLVLPFPFPGGRSLFPSSPPFSSRILLAHHPPTSFFPFFPASLFPVRRPFPLRASLIAPLLLYSSILRFHPTNDLFLSCPPNSTQRQATPERHEEPKHTDDGTQTRAHRASNGTGTGTGAGAGTGAGTGSHTPLTTQTPNPHTATQPAAVRPSLTRALC